MRKFFVALVLAATILPAFAEILTFRYTATVSGGGTMRPGGTYLASAIFDGYEVVSGNTVSGTLMYDTMNPAWTSPRPNWQLYQGTAALSLKVHENGFEFHSSSDDKPTLQVGNDSSIYPGADFFALQTHTFWPEATPRYWATFFAYDGTGTTFDGIGLPSTLNLHSFQQTQVSLYFNQGEDDWAHFDATLASLELVSSVPEPSAAAIWLSGLAVLLGVRKLGRKP